MGDILASGSWKGIVQSLLNLIVEGMEMGKHRSGSRMVSSLLHGRLGGREEWAGSLC